MGQTGRDALGDPIRPRVGLGRLECLRVVVDRDHARRAESERGDPEDTGTATVIDQRLASEIETIEPGQT